MQMAASAFTTAFEQTKTQLRELLLDRLGRTASGAPKPSTREQARPLLSEMLETPSLAALSAPERERLTREVLDDVCGLGPLQSLMGDPSISDILVNGHEQVFIEQGGQLHSTRVRFSSERHLLQVIEGILARVGRQIAPEAPIVDARLDDGSRVHAIIRPLAIHGPCLSIRRFGVVSLRAEELVRKQMLSPAMLEVLAAMVRGRLNILIAGASGAGKTTLLNALSAFIPPAERIITIEDAAELQLKQPHVVQLECRPPDFEGKGAVQQRQLVIASLRMRPDRIIVGEVRSEEAFDMLQAMNTGHDGSLSTIHANSPRDALSRIEDMVSMSGLQIPTRTVRRHIASAIHALVQVRRFSDGSRRVMAISEINGMENDVILMQDVFRFEHTMDRGRVSGEFQCLGRPALAERLSNIGVKLSPNLFTAGPSQMGEI